MVEHQEHFGRKFYQDKKRGYWFSTDSPRVYAHRWVWINVHGKIPPNYHIHHKNEDKSDNRLENLELIEKSRHMSHHMQDPKKKERARLMADKYRPLTKAWHASEEGRAWHKAHGILTWIDRKLIKVICKVCSTEVKTRNYHQEFCSNKCKSKWRRDNGLDDVERICGRCSSIFIVNKYSKQKYCARSCLNKKSDEIINLRNKGYTYQKIGEMLKMNRKTVTTVLKNMNMR